MQIFAVPNTYMITDSYADNEIVCRELNVSLPYNDWCKFSKQPFYSQLIEYLHNEGIQENSESIPALINLTGTIMQKF